MILEIANDADEIISFYSRPEIYSQIHNDRSACLAMQAEKIVRDGYSYRILVDGNLAGFVLIEKIELINLAIAHIAMEDKYRGVYASKAAQAVELYLWSQGIREIQLHIPEYNLAAQYLAGRLGFERYDTQFFSWPQNGINYDIICYRKVSPCLKSQSQH